MSLAKMLTASVIGAMSFSSTALASRDLTELPDGFPTHLPDGTPFPSFPRPPRPSVPVPRPPVGPPGNPVTPPTSIVKCTAVATGFNQTENDMARASAAVETAAFMCGEGEATADAVASATASAFVKAIASASVACEGEGDIDFEANAYARSVATANVWVEAYAEAAATAVLCDKCEAFIFGWGYIGKYVFLRAVAEAEASISGTADATGNAIFTSLTQTQEAISEAFVTAYAEALAASREVYGDHECAAFGRSEGCIYSEEDPFGSCVECVMTAVSYGETDAINNAAEAGANAISYVCGDNAVAYADTSVTATALAEATALAVSYVHVSCETDEGGYACADVGSHIELSAMAVAEAYAHGMADALVCGDECVVDVDAAVSAIGEALATAATEAYGSVCAADGTGWTVEGFAQAYDTKYLVAIAEAVALAFSSNSPATCLAAVTVDTYVGPV